MRENAIRCRNRNIEKWRAHDRERAKLPERKAADYQATKKKRASKPLRFRAHWTVANALRSGELVRSPCEVCGAAEVDGHHDDYSKPLDVRWLCRTHHCEHHTREAAAKRAAGSVLPFHEAKP
jgi:hypothetical protein